MGLRLIVGFRHHIYGAGARAGGNRSRRIKNNARKDHDHALSGIAAIILARNLYVILLQLPDEMSQGAIWRIFYFHVPGAITASLCTMVATDGQRALSVEEEPALRFARRGGDGSRPRFRRHQPDHRHVLGAYHLGHLVDLGCAPNFDAGLLADVFRLSYVAARRRGTHGARAQFGGALDLHFPGRLHYLEVDRMVAHATSRSGVERAQWRRNGARHGGADVAQSARAAWRWPRSWCCCGSIRKSASANSILCGAWRTPSNSRENKHGRTQLHLYVLRLPGRVVDSGGLCGLPGDARASDPPRNGRTAAYDRRS